MTVELLPPHIDTQIAAAVREFWRSRESGSGAQQGGRGHVVGGKNMDPFVDVLLAVTRHVGLPDHSVCTDTASVSLPGYYRPAKRWDVVVVHEHRLLAAVEMKSQVGSFGNNINNRTEEAIGTAEDFRTALRNGLYDGTRFKAPPLLTGEPAPRPLSPAPFTGYVLLLEDCNDTSRPVPAESRYYELDPDLARASYAQRYQLFCERAMHQELYRAAALILSPRQGGSGEGEHRSLSEATSVRRFCAMLAGHLSAVT